MKNTQKKNNRNQVVVWPTTSYFTIKELQKLNMKIVPITLRVKLSEFIADGSVKEIGCKTGGHGRPQKVFVHGTVTKLILEKAKANDINLVDNVDRLSNVVNISTTVSNTTALRPINTPSYITSK